jgi:hypothetical protein
MIAANEAAHRTIFETLNLNEWGFMEDAKCLSGLSHESLYQLMDKGVIRFEKVKAVRFIDLRSLIQFLSTEAGKASQIRSSEVRGGRPKFQTNNSLI